MSEQTQMRDQARGHLIGLAFVAFAAAIGVYIVFAGLGKLGRSPNDAPGWVLVVAGAAFLFAAASMAINAIGWFVFGAHAARDGALSDQAPYPLRVAQMLLSLCIVALLATVATWVAFNPGAGTATRSYVFMIGAALCWSALIGFAIWRLRKLNRCTRVTQSAKIARARRATGLSARSCGLLSGRPESPHR